MAKGNMLLGFAKGKVGSVVFKRVNGDQVTSVKVDPKNPRSQAQMIQRIAFSTAVKTAKALEEIITHSFEGIEYGSKSKNHFVKNAAKVIANNFNEAIDGEHFGTTCAIPLNATGVGSNAALMISEGSLDLGLNISVSVEEQIIDGLKVVPNGASGGISAANAASLFGGNYHNQLTWVFALKEELDASPDVLFYGVRYKVFRLNLKDSVTDDTTVLAYDNGRWIFNTDAIDSSRSDVGFWTAVKFDIAPGSGSVGVLDIQLLIGGCMLSFGAIVSRFDNGTWKRSTCVLSIDEAAEDKNEMYEWRAWNDAEELIALANPAAAGSEDRFLNKEKN